MHLGPSPTPCSHVNPALHAMPRVHACVVHVSFHVRLILAACILGHASMLAFIGCMCPCMQFEHARAAAMRLLYNTSFSGVAACVQTVACVGVHVCAIRYITWVQWECSLPDETNTFHVA